MTSPSLLSQKVTPARPVTLADLWMPLLLFVITVLSTTAVGMRYMHNFRLGLAPITSDADVLPYAWVFLHRADFASGLPFSLTLIGILLAHEFGHYFACRAFAVSSTLPYLLPAPSLSGTFGAVIRLKSRVRTRSALIVIGASGPIAGFVVIIATVIVGLQQSTFASTPVLPQIQPPLLISSIFGMLHFASPLRLIVPHPILVASWIGLLITSLNLVPAGQLDGGHILYALSPAAHRISSRVMTVLLFAMGIFLWAGWLVWGSLLLLPGMKHPRIPSEQPVTLAQYALVPVCAVILLLAGMLQPFQSYSLITLLQRLIHHHF